MQVTEAGPYTRNAKGVLVNSFNLGSASSGQFQLKGGEYLFEASAIWGGGSAQLQKIGPDGSTLVSVGTALTANGSVAIFCPPGTYQITITTATAVFACISSIPY